MSRVKTHPKTRLRCVSLSLNLSVSLLFRISLSLLAIPLFLSFFLRFPLLSVISDSNPGTSQRTLLCDRLSPPTCVYHSRHTHTHAHTQTYTHTHPHTHRERERCTTIHTSQIHTSTHIYTPTQRTRPHVGSRGVPFMKEQFIAVCMCIPVDPRTHPCTLSGSLMDLQ